MAIYERTEPITAVTGEDMTAALHKFVVYTTTARAVIVNTTANVRVAGICAMNAPTSATGIPIPIVPPDGCIAKVLAAATLTAGDYVESDNAGKAVAYSDTADHQCLGVVVIGGASGDVISIQFQHMGTGGS